MIAQVAQARRRPAAAPASSSRVGAREQDLAAVAGRQQAGQPWQRGADVLAAGQLGRAGVQRHPHGGVRQPTARPKRPLGGQRGGQRGVGRGEGGGEARAA